MIEACERILEYVKGLTKDKYIVNTMVQDAVLRNIMVLGEATSNLYECLPELETKYPQIAWIDIYGMRNRIVHGYFFINRDLVWEVATQRIPELNKQLLEVLKAMQG